MHNTVDFTAAIIHKRLDEVAKVRKPVYRIKEGEELDEPKLDVDDEVEKDTSVDIENADNFEESITDDVYFCAKCNKYFIATDETPEEEIKCPVCEEPELIVRIGSAQEALDNEENKDVKSEMDEEESEEESEEEPLDDMPEEDLDVDVEDIDFEDEKFESTRLRRPTNNRRFESNHKVAPVRKVQEAPKMFDNAPLEEGLSMINKRYLNKSDKIKFTEGVVNKLGNLIIKGRYVESNRPVFVTVEGFKAQSGKPKFILEGTTNTLKNSKFKFLFVREGTCYKITKFGFGFIKESGSKTQKITGVIVDEAKKAAVPVKKAAVPVKKAAVPVKKGK